MAVKSLGIWMAILGSMIGGIIGNKFGIMKTLLLGAILHLASHVFFIVLAMNGYSVPLLYATVIAENITGGLMTCGFVAYFSMLCNVRFTATQYTLFSAFMAQTRVIVQSQSGIIAEYFGWVDFFIFISLASIPSIIILLFLMRKYPLPNPVLRATTPITVDG
jgi:PAT family beta-lactamase induction signal transducer AmpG